MDKPRPDVVQVPVGDEGDYLKITEEKVLGMAAIPDSGMFARVYLRSGAQVDVPRAIFDKLVAIGCAHDLNPVNQLSGTIR